MPGSEAYEQWLHQERQSWERQILATLDLLAEAEAAAADWKLVLHHARMALAIDPLQERFHRCVMNAHYHAGDRAAALSQYAQCQRQLYDSLAVQPDSVTRKLRDAIAAGSLAPASHTTAIRSETASLRPGPDPQRLASLPLVGREAELGQLEDAIARACHGAARVIVLHGEAGIGKSRLVEEALLRQDHSGVRRAVLFGHCRETTAGLAYEPLLAAFDRLLPSIDLTGLPLSDAWLAEVAWLLPDLAVLRPGLLPTQPLDPAMEHRRLFEGIARLVAAVPGLSLIVLEAIQWADKGTLFLLAYLARHPLLSSVAIVVTMRPAELPDSAEQVLSELQQDKRLRYLPLGPLSARAVGDLVIAATGRRYPEFAEQLHKETEGNPLFVTEFLHALREAGALQPELGSLPSHLPVSPALQGVIRARLERIPAPARELVRVASIFAGAAPFSTLTVLSALPEAIALTALDFLIRAGVFREVEDGGVRPAITFCHNLFRRVSYADLTKARRAALHRRLARSQEACQLLASGAGSRRPANPSPLPRS